MAKTAIPSTAAELESMISDRSQVEQLLNNGEFPDVIKAYAKTLVEKDTDLKAQIVEQTQMGLADLISDGKVTADVKRLNQAALRGAAKKHGAVYDPKADGARLDGVYDSVADAVRANWHRAGSLKDRAELADKREKAAGILNSYSSNVPADGGFLIPEVMRDEVLSVALEQAIMRPLSTVIPMESLTVKIPMIDDTSHATNVFGGVQAYWTEEAAALVESQGSFGAIKLEAEKLTAYTEYPNELFEDASAFGGLLNKWMPEAVAYFEDVAFIAGSGAGEPQGFLNATSAVTVAKESGQAAGTIVWENIVKMYARMLPTSIGKAVWVAHIDTFPELATMALSVGTGGSAIWLNNGQVGPPMTILGRPVIFTEKVPSVGAVGDINFVDASYYLIGDRQVMQVDVSPHYKFQNDKSAVRVIERVTGRPWLQAALTPRNGNNKLSPFVKLATRS
ncbi:phage major capsid protein [Streptomyces sp. VNUA74]|uniref:phage major capsid protein n=1 Tax=Streptomyces sp. VNUA74 TaxID=3062685 RepID=UPI00280AA12E|nr:phage major capsid protein [Streptomyces sp. VNUA74]WML79175.1 phage major capsid protein [Streptomyces sp. VNUA74]